MTLYAFGLNYEQVPVHVTEVFSIDEVDQRELYATLGLSKDAEVIYLSTCNRTEVYLYGTEQDVQAIQDAFGRRSGQPWPAERAFLYEDEEAIQHVLEVTSGIRSMVPGDGQILSQVKDAYRCAVETDAVDSLLHRLMHTAFRAAKRVATETDLSSGAASVSTASIAMARDHFRVEGRDLSDIHILLIGAGKMGQLALKALGSSTPASITVTNRSPKRAQTVADTHDGTTVGWEDRHQAIQAADFVIVATGAPEPIICNGVLPCRTPGSRPALLVDISMPRNVETGIDDRLGYAVYDLDDLQQYVQNTEDRRGEEIPKARAICQELLSDFVTWVFHQQALQPAIEAIRSTFDAIREQEVDRHAHRTGMDRDEVDRLTKSIMQKLLAVPIVKLKNVDPDSIDFARGIKLLHALFSRPTCEDESAETSQGRDYDPPSLSDAPAQCPFETHSSDQSEKMLRRAIMSADHAANSEPPSD